MSNPLSLETAEYQLWITPSAAELDKPKPASSTIRVHFGAVSETGKVRANNEDHFLVSRVSRKQDILMTNVPENQFPAQTGEDGYSIIVADGMGGMAAGEVASRLAITTGVKLFQKSPKWGFKVNQKEARELFQRVSHHLQEIDRTLTERSYSDRHLFGMGTTLTLAYSIGVDLFIIHLGDSRAYLYREGELKQLTKDHTVAQAMADAGYIAPEEVRHHRKRNALTNFLGGHDGKVKADIRWLRLADGDRLLVCSDGLNEMVDDASIARVLGEHARPDDAAQVLVDEALDRGGKDNVTVVVARYEIPSPTASDRQESREHALSPQSATDSFDHEVRLSSFEAIGGRH